MGGVAESCSGVEASDGMSVMGDFKFIMSDGKTIVSDTKTVMSVDCMMNELALSGIPS